MTRVERAIRKLVDRYFERADEEVVMYNVINDCANGEFDNFRTDQIRYICIESISRLEGEHAVELAKECIAEQYNNFEVTFDLNGETIYVGA